MRQFTALLLALCLLAFSAAAYSDYAYSARVELNPDGTAKVMEKSVFLFEKNDERAEFERNLNLGESTISEWQKFSKNVRFHFRGGINNVRITAKKEFTVGFDAGTVIIEYDIETPIVIASREGSRKTVYSLSQEALGFEVTNARETILGSNMQLSIALPGDAEVVKVAPLPDAKAGDEFTWNGPIARRWEVVYSREIPLSQEVSQFFSDSYLEVVEFLPSILLVLLALIVGFILVKFRHK